MKERDAEFFRPLWRRVLVTAIVAGWLLAEVLGLFGGRQDQFWMVLVGLALVYCIYTFFIRFPKEPPAGAAPPGEPPAGDSDKSA